MTERHVRLDVEALETFCRDIFALEGLSDEDAQAAATVLVAADVRGIASHGVGRLSRYVKGLQAGLMLPNAPIEVLSDTPTALVGGSGIVGRIVFTLADPVRDLASRVAARFPGGTVQGTTARVACARLEDDLHHVFEIARGAGSTVRDLAVHAPTLEDVYLARTGRAWPGGEPMPGEDT